MLAAYVAVTVVAGFALPADSRPHPIVATPNAGEFEHTFHGDPSLPPDQLLAAVTDLAHRLRATVVVKGLWDTVSDGARAAPLAAHRHCDLH